MIQGGLWRSNLKEKKKKTDFQHSLLVPGLTMNEGSRNIPVSLQFGFYDIHNPTNLFIAFGILQSHTFLPKNNITKYPNNKY